MDPVSRDDPSLTADLLEIYFDADGDIWTATRATPDSPWQTPAVVAELVTLANLTSPEVSPDGLTLFISARAGGSLDIFVATRPGRDAAWSSPVPVAELNSARADVASVVNRDRTHVVLCTDRGVPGDDDIYLATRVDVEDLWTTPVPVTEVNSNGDDCSPFLDADGLALYFERQRDENDDYDLFATTRPTVADPFEPPVRIDELATAEDERDPWVSPDGRYMVFSRSVAGRYQLFETWR